MILLEDILEETVKTLDVTPIGKPMFYWGVSEDLPLFMSTYKENAIPLIWLVSGYDKPTEDGYYRDAEINFCTRETNVDLTNITRIKEQYSYKKILMPLLANFLEAINYSENMWIEDSPEILKSPNHSVNDENEVSDIWDVLKIKVRIYFNENNNC